MTYHLDYRVHPPAVIGVGEGPPGHGDTSVRLSRNADGPAPDRRHSVRGFHLLAEADRAQLARVVTEQPLGSRLTGHPAVYHVLDAYGAPLGRITYRRRRAFQWRREQWTVEPLNGPALHGYAGRLVWWVLWWPLGFPLYLLLLLWAVLGDGDTAFRPPRRITWRDPSGRAHFVFRAVAERYELLTPQSDPRVINALVGLHQSFDPNESARNSGWY